MHEILRKFRNSREAVKEVEVVVVVESAKAETVVKVAQASVRIASSLNKIGTK